MQSRQLAPVAPSPKAERLLRRDHRLALCLARQGRTISQSRKAIATFPVADGIGGIDVLSHHLPKPKGYCDLARVVSRSMSSHVVSHHLPKPKGYCDTAWSLLETLEIILSHHPPKPKGYCDLPRCVEEPSDISESHHPPKPKGYCGRCGLGPLGRLGLLGLLSAPYGATERTRAVGGVVWAMGGPWRVGWAVAPDGAGPVVPVVPVGPVGPGCREPWAVGEGRGLIFCGKGVAFGGAIWYRLMVFA